MKTTVELSDALLEEAKREAARRGTTLRALLEQGLRAVLTEGKSRARFRLRDASFGGKGIDPAFEEGQWDELRRLAYEGRGG